MSGKRKRVKFCLRERIRDHHDCSLYEDCLSAAAGLNSPRVCWEGCPLFMEPAPNENLVIAEILDYIRDQIPKVAEEKGG